MVSRILFGGRLGKILLAVYLVAGLLVASSHNYFAHLGGIKSIVSAVLAVLLWPLVLVGLKLVIK